MVACSTLAVPETLSIPIDEGFALAADAWGDPAAAPVLFLHGGGQTHHSWGGAARILAGRGYRTMTIDLRGHGESGWSPSGNYGIDAFVDDLKLVRGTLSAPPVLVGASLGGVAALLAAGEGEPEFCKALVLVDIAPRVEPRGVARIGEFMRANPDGFASLEEAADAVATYRRHRSRPKDISGLHKNLRLRENGRYYWHWDPSFLAQRGNRTPHREERLRDAAAALRVPTLLVRGKNSDVVSEQGVHEFLQLVPHGEYVDVSGAGHMVAGDRNDVFGDAVLAFLEKQEE
ncbi:MAG: alpha/beta hydrolase [SAR324 cluster bacterium]|nr:alpha/beta hydrolase [SAR324 cluster bacterium]